MNNKELLNRVHTFLSDLCRDGKCGEYCSACLDASDLADDVWNAIHSTKGAEAPTGGMTFGMAIEAMKQGAKVARKGWNGKGMYLWILPAASVNAEWCKEPHLKELAEQNGGEVECLGSVRMKTADGKVLTGWLASQTDILSEDWCIVE